MNIQGKFHSHITVICDNDHIPALKLLCKTLRCVITVIDLEKDTKSQRDIMLTHHFYIGRGKYNSVDEIKTELENACSILTQNGFNVVRTKLEHESLPTVTPSESTYREVHFKCIMPVADRDVILATVRSSNDTLVPSSNPYENLGDGNVTQFINKRFYIGSVEEADTESDEIASMLGTLCSVIEVKRESVVYDSNLSHDRWWA